jgi:hypothetical protein
MKSAKGIWALFIILVTFTSSVVAFVLEPVNAQSTPVPAPEISVAFVNHSYDVPSTIMTTTNPYTGDKVETTKEGYHIQNDSFVLSVRSQACTIDNEARDSNIGLFFIVQSKGHYSDYWKNLTYVGNSLPLMYTNNGYAQKTMQLTGNNGTTYAEEGGYNNYGYDGFVDGQYGGQVDFRAMTIIGYIVVVQDDPNLFNFRHPYHNELVTLQSSNWSNTQTITINGDPTGTPTSPLNTVIIIIAGVLLLAVPLSIWRLRKH